MAPIPSNISGKLLLGDHWEAGMGPDWSSRGPLDEQDLWRGRWATLDQADRAVAEARSAFPAWSVRSLDDRIETCRRFASYLEQHKLTLGTLIAQETGKPKWEALAEVTTAVGKVANSIDAILARRWTSLDNSGSVTSVTRFRPHGVMLVLGPFNLPAHLPGAHMVPALLAGNTVVFKPSELVPAVGEWLVGAWQQAGLPAGVVNLIHGQAEVARHLVEHPLVDGILFTGSYHVGVGIHRLLAGKPEKVLALEMGGNNPLIVHDVAKLESTLLPIIESAYITSGQRCTCARRLIVTESLDADRLSSLLRKAIQSIRVATPFAEPQPFMGPLIREVAANRVLMRQQRLLEMGCVPVVLASQDHDLRALVTPGLLDATNIELEDEEIFGPILTIQQVSTLEQAIQLAGQTRFGLSAGLLSDSVDAFQYGLRTLRAGIINWNRQTTGASGRLPFGGVGASGNHAPSGYFAADYCSYPVASMESEHLASLADASVSVSPGLDQVATLCIKN